MNDEQIRARTVGRITNALNQFKRELASDGVDTSKLTLEFVIDALLNYSPEPLPNPEDEVKPVKPSKKNAASLND